MHGIVIAFLAAAALMSMIAELAGAHSAKPIRREGKWSYRCEGRDTVQFQSRAAQPSRPQITH